MKKLSARDWLPPQCDAYVEALAHATAASRVDELGHELEALVQESRVLHERLCINLNPASNVMNPRAEALLARGLSSRASLGYPAHKHEMGLEAIERIEVMAQELSAEIFDCNFVEYRVPSGTLANLAAFMALARPGETIIAVPAAVGGHVSHHSRGVAGRFGLRVIDAPVDAKRYTIDADALRRLARESRPTLITVGGSLNLFEPPLAEIRQIADEVGARVLFDAAHLAGPIAGKAWPHPLQGGAHLMTMSTYKSLGGPAGSLIVTNDAGIAQRLEEAAFPGLTANFDVSKTAALGMAMLDWKLFGSAYAAEMVASARALAHALAQEGVSVFASEAGGTRSHQLAILPPEPMSGYDAAIHLGKANLLASAISVPDSPSHAPAAVRLGTPEIVRWGMRALDMPRLAKHIGDALLGRRPLAQVAADVTSMKQEFGALHFIHQPERTGSGLPVL